MIPTIESQKTIGLVQLPGMMSGQIIAGAEPLKAVQFQLLVLFLLLTTAAITSAMLGFLAYPTLFNERIQMLKLKNNLSLIYIVNYLVRILTSTVFTIL